MKKKLSNKKDKWGKKQVFFISAEPYKQDIIVVINGQFSDAMKLIKRQKTPSAKLIVDHVEKAQNADKEDYADNYVHNSGSAFTYTGLPKAYVVLLSHEDIWIDTVDSVVHECLHLTHYILKGVGIVLCKESEEAYTYLQGAMVKKILKRMY